MHTIHTHTFIHNDNSDCFGAWRESHNVCTLQHRDTSIAIFYKQTDCSRPLTHPFIHSAIYSFFSWRVRAYILSLSPSRALELPDQPKQCELRNDTIFEVVCSMGNDGGLPQYFLLEVVGGNPVSPDFNRNDFDNNLNTNEISTMNDQATTAPLRRIKESVPEFRLYDLEPGREYQFLVYAVNAKGRSHPPVVMQGKTFSDIIGPHGKHFSFHSSRHCFHSLVFLSVSFLFSTFFVSLLLCMANTPKLNHFYIL